MTSTTKEQPFEQARAALLDSQRHVNRAPMCCSDGIEAAHEIKPSRIPWGIVIVAIIGLGFSLALFGYANAAERNQFWDVFAFRDGRLLQAGAANIVPVQSSGPFQSRRECINVGIQTVRIRDAGWKLSCRRVDQ